jgi:hypothetical protein
LLVAAGDCPAFAAAIVRIIRDGTFAARLVSAGIREGEHHCVETHVMQLLAVYRAVMANSTLTVAHKEEGVALA